MTRRKHQDKTLEALLAEAERKGWRVEKNPRGYYRLRCPCKNHQTWVHLTPSNPRYAQERRRFLEGTGCW